MLIEVKNNELAQAHQQLREKVYIILLYIHFHIFHDNNFTITAGTIAFQTTATTSRKGMYKLTCNDCVAKLLSTDCIGRTTTFQ